MMCDVRVLDLFSGIGGFSLGLERAGMRTVAFCENDDYCCRVLRKHWPGVPIHGDICELDGSQYAGSVQLVCGGFPCQPYSVAGKQRGSDDQRALWPEMFRVICEVQPAWVIGENVVGIVGMELDKVLSDLEGANYAVQTFDIPACGIDAHHIRHRIWIIANASGNRIRKQSGRRGGSNGTEALRSELASEDDVANPNAERKLQSQGAEQEERRRLGNGGEGDVANAEIEGLQDARGREGKATQHTVLANPSRWEPEPSVGRVAHGISSRVDRLRGLGNAVVPAVVEAIGRAILEM